MILQKIFKPQIISNTCCRTQKIWNLNSVICKLNFGKSNAALEEENKHDFDYSNAPAIEEFRGVGFDRSGLNMRKEGPDAEAKFAKPKSKFVEYLLRLIRARGPLMYSSYMREILTNGEFGYYMKQDVFGESGDFITAPEISQMFGELIGVWCVSIWEKLGKPKKFQLIECGPGRGTLCFDLLRATAAFPEFTEAISGVHLVEVSPFLKQTQAKKFQVDFLDLSKGLESSPKKQGRFGHFYQWHPSLLHVRSNVQNYKINPIDTENEPCIVIGQEFLDVLPIHKFVVNSFIYSYTEKGWRECMIELDDTLENEHFFRPVVAATGTPAAFGLLGDVNNENREVGDTLEVPSEAQAFCQRLATRIENTGGAALMIDYGDDFTFSNSLRAIKNHKLIDSIFESPGECDLTYNVDFSAVRRSIKEGSKVETYGPIEQGKFLRDLGIEARLTKLLRLSDDNSAKILINGFKKLTDNEEMGKIYKVFSFTHPIGKQKIQITDQKEKIIPFYENITISK